MALVARPPFDLRAEVVNGGYSGRFAVAAVAWHAAVPAIRDVLFERNAQNSGVNLPSVTSARAFQNVHSSVAF